MSRNGGTMAVTVGGVKLEVPVFEDAVTTQAIVQKVNQRLSEIEASSSRIDTQAFALQTAVSFAMELAELQSETEWENRELLNALSAILKNLHKTLEEADERPSR